MSKLFFKKNNAAGNTWLVRPYPAAVLRETPSLTTTSREAVGGLRPPVVDVDALPGMDTAVRQVIELTDFVNHSGHVAVGAVLCPNCPKTLPTHHNVVSYVGCGLGLVARESASDPAKDHKRDHSEQPNSLFSFFHTPPPEPARRREFADR